MRRGCGSSLVATALIDTQQLPAHLANGRGCGAFTTASGINLVPRNAVAEFTRLRVSDTPRRDVCNRSRDDWGSAATVRNGRDDAVGPVGLTRSHPTGERPPGSSRYNPPVRRMTARAAATPAAAAASAAVSSSTARTVSASYTCGFSVCGGRAGDRPAPPARWRPRRNGPASRRSTSFLRVSRSRSGRRAEGPRRVRPAG